LYREPAIKHINAHTTLILILAFTSLLLSVPVQQGNAAEYYIYRDSRGALVISNQKPPPGSQIIRQRDFPEAPDSQVPQTNAGNNSQPKRWE
jgi:hypothetical protein